MIDRALRIVLAHRRVVHVILCIQRQKELSGSSSFYYLQVCVPVQALSLSLSFSFPLLSLKVCVSKRELSRATDDVAQIN